MKKRLLRALIASSLLLFSPSNAMAKTYIVEMIAFTNEGDSAERWNFSAEQSATRERKVNAIYARSESLNSGEDLSYLEGVYSALAGSAEHRILKAARWTQESANYQDSPLVKIDNDDLSIKGGLRVYAPNLLFAELNLMFAPNDSLAITAASGKEAYFIDERRRMKLEETHYFDHSKFGVVLIVVSPMPPL